MVCCKHFAAKCDFIHVSQSIQPYSSQSEVNKFVRPKASGKYIHTYVRTYVRTYIRTYLSIYIYIYIYSWIFENMAPEILPCVTFSCKILVIYLFFFFFALFF